MTESGGLGREEVGMVERVDKGTLGAMNMLIILIVVMISWVYSSVKTHQIVTPSICNLLYVNYASIKHGKYFFKECLKVKSLHHVWLFATTWTVAHQAPPPMGFSRQEYWSGLPFPSPEDLPNPGVEPRSPALLADALLSEPPGNPW